MDESSFRLFLKRAGKKEHVVDGLVAHVKAFELYLACKRHTGLGTACPEDIKHYAETLPVGEMKKRMRGLSLYFRFAGDLALARAAAEFREQAIARQRPAFKLRGLRGVNLEDIRQLEACGIVTVEHMLAAAKTPGLRRRLSERTCVAPATILELVKLSDLTRLGAVKGVRARLYYEAGLDTPDKFTEWQPERLHTMLIEFVRRTRFNGIAPLPKELANAIAKAKQLPSVVQY